MKEQLTKDDIDFILTSLEYTRMNFENTQYPTYELRQSQLQRVDSVKAKVRALRDNLLEKTQDSSDKHGQT